MSYQVSEQVVGVLDHLSWQPARRHGNQHHLEAAEEQEDEED